MITIKSQREIDLMAKSGEFLASIHRGLRDLIKPGIDMWDIEEYVRKRCKEANALPLQIGVEGSIMDYPYATCCSLNDEVAHAFPRHQKLVEGDIICVDMVVGLVDKAELDVSKLDFNKVSEVKKYTESFRGGVAGSCWAYAVGKVSPEAQQLMDVTKECLYRGIEAAQVGNRIGDIGAAIQDVFLSQSDALTPVCESPEHCFARLDLGAKADVNQIHFSTGGGAPNAAVTFSRQGD